ncbi:MAG: DUF5348 domain-containing protein [Sporolactobacillus sp.]
MRKETFEMTYNHDHQQWFVNMHGTSYGMHRGEHFEIKMGSRRLPCRLELRERWYIITNEVRFDLTPREHYQILY